jgi:tRNA(Glu) U13 pseudouridine synthase TruD
MNGLARFELRQERRALRLPVQGLVWTRRQSGIQFSFELPAGSYGTSVSRELANCMPNSGQEFGVGSRNGELIRISSGRTK